MKSLDKIRKQLSALKAMAENSAPGSEHEAALAAQRMADICERYNIEVGSVELAKQETEASESVVPLAGDYQAYCSSLIYACEAMFNVGSFRRPASVPLIIDNETIGLTAGYEIVFYGLKSSVESAAITFTYLKESVRVLLGSWCLLNRGVTPTKRRDWQLGCSSMIHEMALIARNESRQRIEASADAGESKALVLLSNRLVEEFAAKKKFVKAARPAGVRNIDAWGEGRQAGTRINRYGAQKGRMLTA